jgi:Zn-finger nucleic acid-binding protein
VDERELVKPIRMLLACTACHRQYDVGDHPPGAKVRCLCGALNVVRPPRPRQVEMFHCSNCGGKLAQGEVRCSYCAAEVRLGARGLGPACPECLATTLVDAKHCSTCGVELHAQAVVRALADRPCPRCKHQLSECETDVLRYVECTSCGGLWLDERIFEQVVEQRDTLVAESLPHAQSVPDPTPRLEARVSYLPCPVCGQTMNRRNFATISGVVLDWCRGHGWWFDAEELGSVLAFVDRGGLERAREKRHEQRKFELERRERKANEKTMNLERFDDEVRGAIVGETLLSVVALLRRLF